MEGEESSDEDCEADMLPAQLMGNQSAMSAMSGGSEAKGPPHRMVKTVCLILLWICLGLIAAVGSTTLVDFSEILAESYTHIGLALSLHFIFILIGLFLSGLLADRLGYSRELLVGLSSIVMSVSNIFKPYSGHVTVFTFLLGMEGLFKGITKPAANNLLMTMWGKKAPVPVTLFHFGWGVGHLMGPFLTQPFLSEKCPNSTTTSDPICEVTVDDKGTLTAVKYLKPSRIEIPFAITGSLMIIMGLFFLLIYYRDQQVKRREEFEMQEKKDIANNRNETEEKGPPRGRYGLAIVAFLVLFYFTLAGSGFGGYLFTIAYESDLHCSKEDASKIAATFGAAFTGGRLLAAFILHFASIKTVFIFYVFGTFASMLGMRVFGLASKTSLWIFSAICPFYRAPLWPGAMAWANNYIYMSTFNIAVIEAGACIGDALFLWIGGSLIDSHHEISIFTMTLVSSTAACLVTIALYIFAHCVGERKPTEAVLEEPFQ